MILDPATCQPMGAEAKSAFVCLGCDESLSRTWERILTKGFDTYDCLCGEESMVDELDVHIIPSSVGFLNADVTRNTSWFHSTKVENWDEEVSKLRPTFVCGSNEMLSVPYVHLGTLDAAMTRFEDTKAETGWLYEIRIRDEAVIADEVYEDRNDWEQYVRTGFFEGVLEDKKKCDAIRYINRWESVGSISLIMDPRFIEVVAVSSLEGKAAKTKKNNSSKKDWKIAA
jgi:hypothetical protein